MGCFNGTCAVSNLHITSNQDVVVFMLLENKNKKTFCYTNALYDVSPVPFYGQYNDYGAVEGCEGFGLNLVVEAIRSQLYEFGQGPNPYHDTPVTRADFNIELLFDADHQGRLGVEHTSSWDEDEYDLREMEKIRLEQGLTVSQQFELDRLANKIKKVDTFRAITHVMIHKTVFDNIIQKWYIEQYVGDSAGNKGYENNYIHLYFQDILDSIPEYITDQKKIFEDDKQETNPQLAAMAKVMRRFSGNHDHRHPNLATRWLGSVGRGSESNAFGLIDVQAAINDYVDAADWDGLESFVKEVLTGVWISTFMNYNHKLWSKQCTGGQDRDADGHILLANTIKEILAAEKAEWDEENGEE